VGSIDNSEEKYIAMSAICIRLLTQTGLSRGFHPTQRTQRTQRNCRNYVS